MKPNLEQFKAIADTLLEEIQVSSELKYKTLDRCTSSFLGWKKVLLVPCTALLLTFILYPPIYLHEDTNTNTDFLKKNTVSVNTKQESMPNSSSNTALNISLPVEKAISAPSIGEVNKKKSAVPSKKEDKKAIQKYASFSDSTLTAEETNKSKPELSIASPSGSSPAENSNNNAMDSSLNRQTTPEKGKEFSYNTDVPLSDAASALGSENSNGTQAEVSSSPPVGNTNERSALSKNGSKKNHSEDSKSISAPLNSSKNAEEKSDLQLTIEKGEKLLNSEDILPTYIPKDFNLVGIQIINEDSSTSCTIQINYKKDTSYFTISESKKLNTNSNEDLKQIKLTDSITGYYKTVSATDPNSSLTWESASLQYCIESNVDENTLIEIAKSFKFP